MAGHQLLLSGEGNLGIAHRLLRGLAALAVLFDVGNNQVKRVPLMDPLRGTASLTSDLLDQVETVDALLAKLKA